MKGIRFSEERIIGILKEHKAGVSVVDLCRKRGQRHQHLQMESEIQWDGSARGQATTASI